MNVKELWYHYENEFKSLDPGFESKHTSHPYERLIVPGLQVGRLLGDNEEDGAGSYGRCAVFLHSRPPPH